jgi:hypothetical protein
MYHANMFAKGSVQSQGQCKHAIHGRSLALLLIKHIFPNIETWRHNAAMQMIGRESH